VVVVVPPAGAVANATPPVLVARGVKAIGVNEGEGVRVGAAKAVAVRSAENVLTAWVRISSTLTVAVGVKSAGVAPQALSNIAPRIIIVCIPTINRNLSILTPFLKRRYCTWILFFVQRAVYTYLTIFLLTLVL
jgi:hypothetical protein